VHLVANEGLQASECTQQQHALLQSKDSGMWLLARSGDSICHHTFSQPAVMPGAKGSIQQGFGRKHP
jgi:hypothetical protein